MIGIGEVGLFFFLIFHAFLLRNKGDFKLFDQLLDYFVPVFGSLVQLASNELGLPCIIAQFRTIIVTKNSNVLNPKNIAV